MSGRDAARAAARGVMISLSQIVALPLLTACSADAGGRELQVEEAGAAAPGAGRAADVSFEVARGAATARDTGGTSPERPRLTIDSREAATPSPGRRLHARSSAALAEALRTAKPGDVILLTPGTTYTGNFVLPHKGGGTGVAWITLRTDGGSVPAEGRRVTPAAATGRGLARLVTPNASPALATEAGAHHYRVVGVEVSAAPNVAAVYSLVALGSAGDEQKTAPSIPHHLVLDRVYVHGTPTLGVRRCVGLNSAWTAVVDSWLAECHSNDGDSQAIWGSNGPGPFKIANSYLEGAGENLMFGGGDPHVRGLVPSDIEIRRNHFYKPPSWKGKWSVKNLLELKLGRRVVVEANVFENNWVDAQVGYAIVMKSVNQDGTAPWSETSDVLMRYNRVTGVAAGLSLSGRPEQHPVGSPLSRVRIEENLVALGDPAVVARGEASYSRGVIVGAEPRDITLRHNTIVGARNCSILLATQDWSTFEVTDNAFGVGTYGGIKGDGSQEPRGPNEGTDILATYTKPGGYRFAGNAVWSPGPLAPAVRGAYPAPNVLVERTGEERVFANARQGDFRIALGTFRRAASRGRDPGVDISSLDSATAGVVVENK